MKQSFFQRRGFVIILVAVFLMPFLMRGTKLALRTNRNDVKDWLPGDFPETQTHRWFQEHFPHEQFVLASWEGCTLDDDRLEMLADKLESFNPNLEDLDITGKVAELLEDNRLHTREAIQRFGPLSKIEGIDPKQAVEVEKIVRQWNSPFKSPVLTGSRLKDDLQTQYPELSEKAVLKRLEGSLIDKLPDRAVHRPSGKRKTCLVVTLSSAAKGRKLRGTLDQLRRLADECGIPQDQLHMGGPPVDNVAIDIEGERTLFRLAALSAVFGLGISWLCFRSIRLTLLVFFVAILAAGIGLSSVYFASLGMRLLGLEGIGSTYGVVDAILLSMPSLVYVLTMSGAIHIINYYHDVVREHGLEGAPQRALGLGWLPCFLAAVTTSLGLGSLLASRLVPISKFGIYSAWGVLASLALLFLFLPACLHFFPSREHVKGGPKYFDPRTEKTVFVRFWHGMGRVVIKHNLLVTAACLLLMGMFVVGLYRIQPSVKLMKLFSPEARIVEDYAWLEDQIGPLVPMELVVRVDGARCRLNTVQRMRMARDVERTIERDLKDDVGGALSAAVFAPPIGPTSDRAKVRLGWSVRDSRTSQGIDQFRDALGTYLQVDRDKAVADDGWDPTLEELGIAAETAELLRAAGLQSLGSIELHGELASVQGLGPVRAAAAAETIQAWRTAHRNPTLEEMEIPDRIAGPLLAEKLPTLRAIEQYCGRESIAENLWDIEGIGPEEAAEVAAVIDQWRIDHGQELWRVGARVKALTDLDYSQFVDELRGKVEAMLDRRYRVLSQEEMAGGAEPVQGVSVVYTGLVPLVYKAQHELLAGLYTSLKWAFVLIGIVMILVLRSPSAGLLSMIPNVFPVVLVFGAMGLIGIKVDAGTMMTASVALGVAVDDTIHFLTWFRRGLDQGRDRKGAVMLAYERCGTAMTQTTLIGGLGLSAFAFSTFTPTQRFGVLMLTLLTAALIGDLIFLPAILSGPIGRFFGLSRKKRRPKGLPPGGTAAEDDDAEDDAAEDAAAELPQENNSGEVIAVPLRHSAGRKPPSASTRAS